MIISWGFYSLNKIQDKIDVTPHGFISLLRIMISDVLKISVCCLRIMSMLARSSYKWARFSQFFAPNHSSSRGS